MLAVENVRKRFHALVNSEFAVCPDVDIDLTKPGDSYPLAYLVTLDSAHRSQFMPKPTSQLHAKSIST